MFTIERTQSKDLHAFFHMHGLDMAGGIVAAFSGGADSLGMLVLLKHAVPGERLIAVYVNHGIREDEELQAEEELNSANCQKLGVPLRIVRLGPNAVAEAARQRKHGLEDSARYLRYTVLEKIRREVGFAYIATAHTKDDQMETLIMRMFQGSGSGGLKGILPVALPILRPVLQYDKGDLVRILQEEQLVWSHDSTNESDVYLRNAVRRKLLPVVEELFPGYRSALDSLGEKNAALDTYLEGQADALAQDVLESNPACVRIDGDLFNRLARPLRERLFYKAWNCMAAHEGGVLSYRSLRYALDVMESFPPDGLSVTLQGSRLTCRDSGFLLQPSKAVLAAGYVSLVYSNWTSLCDRWVLVRDWISSDADFDERALCIDENMLSPPFVARSAVEGDVIVLKEGTKSIAKLFGEWGISPADRWSVPVLEDRVGIFSVLGKAFGGKDSLARRCLLTTLARKRGTLYSVMEYKD